MSDSTDPIFEYPSGVPTQLNADAPLRAAVLSVAYQFERQLEEASKQAGISIPILPDPRTLLTTLAGPLIASGHQAVMYHGGLLEKEVRVSALASSEPNSETTAGIPITFILDTDPDAGGAIAVPLVDSNDIPDPALFSVIASSAEEHAPLPFAQIVSTELPEISLNQFLSQQHAETYNQLRTCWRKLIGKPLPLAHVILRRALGAPAVYQVPFSLLFTAPAVRDSLVEITRYPGLTQRYNEILSSYRTQSGIKNVANPFPNLLSSELPFWVVKADGTARMPLSLAEASASDAFSNNDFVVPRGAFVSALLRSWFSDLFIHGLGGKGYEPAAEQVMAQLFPHWKLAPYAVATRNVYPYQRWLAELEELTARQSLIRSAPSHIDQIESSYEWCTQDREALAKLAQQKSALLAELSELKSDRQHKSVTSEAQSLTAHQGVTRRSTQEIGIEIKQIDNAVRALVAENATIQAEAVRYKALSSIESTISRRNFPFCF